jgi:hypothetical protein
MQLNAGIVSKIYHGNSSHFPIHYSLIFHPVLLYNVASRPTAKYGLCKQVTPQQPLLGNVYVDMLLLSLLHVLGQCNEYL